MPLFLVAVAAALPGRALEFAALGEERASRVGASASRTGVDGIPPAEATGFLCKTWKCKFKAMRIERNALRAELEALKPQTPVGECVELSCRWDDWLHTPWCFAAPDRDAYTRICGLEFSAVRPGSHYGRQAMNYGSQARELSEMILTNKNNWEGFKQLWSEEGGQPELLNDACTLAIDAIIG
jgi:hypothetical protein